MKATRTALLISATAAMFVMAANTGAEAGFLCQRGIGGFQRSYSFAPSPRVSTTTYSNPAPQKKVAKAKPKATVTAAKSPTVASAPTKSPTVASVPTQPPTVASAPVKSSTVVAEKPSDVTETAGSAPTATAPDNCLVKEYVDGGAVRFRDACTKEWAINSTDRERKASTTDRTCLTKQNSQNGVVMFKDVCTGEWAMNTAKQMSLAKAQ